MKKSNNNNNEAVGSDDIVTAGKGIPTHFVIIIHFGLSELLMTGADRGPFRLKYKYTDNNAFNAKADCGTEIMNESFQFNFS